MVKGKVPVFVVVVNETKAFSQDVTKNWCGNKREMRKKLAYVE